MTTDADPAAIPETNFGEELAALRGDIDRIDLAMHGLLIERTTIIDRLIAIKAAQGGGSAFRPAREAEMMRRLVERHAGRLPIDTVESIWRIIISTFTHLQAPYAVHADMAGGDAAMRDSARFHFGFTVPLHAHAGPDEVLRAVAAATGDLGLVRIDDGKQAPWWLGCTGPDAPKVIARLPFVERPDHPAGIPVLVVARPVAAAAARDVVLYSVRLSPSLTRFDEAVRDLGGDILVEAEQDGPVLLAAFPGTITPERIGSAFGTTENAFELAEIGSHAARFELD